MGNWYNRGLKFGTNELSGFTIRVILLGSGYAFDPDHDFISDLVPASNELTDASYARATLASLVQSVDDTNDRASLDAADVVFASLAGGETIAGVAFARFVTNDSDSELLMFQALSPAKTANGGDFKLIVNSLGLVLAQEGDLTLASEDIVERGSGNLSAGALAVTLSEAQPDTDYNPTVTGTADETVYVDDTTKTVSGFTIKSGNGVSTAKVYWEVIR